MSFLVELEPNVWLAEGEGDPPRTLVYAYARAFPNRETAYHGLADARRFRPFHKAQVIELLDDAETVINRYAHHKTFCAALRGDKCTCGLDDAIEKLKDWFNEHTSATGDGPTSPPQRNDAGQFVRSEES